MAVIHFAILCHFLAYPFGTRKAIILQYLCGATLTPLCILGLKILELFCIFLYIPKQTKKERFGRIILSNDVRAQCSLK